MKKLYYFIPAVILLAVSCEKEENLPAFEENEPVSKVEMVTETVSGSRGTSTKALISDADASFSWTEGDNVAVHISNGKYVYTSDEGASGATITDIVHTDDASFTVVYEAGYERDAFALYPSTIVARDAENYGQEGHTLDVTLPGSYTLAQVSGETSPCPMIATDEAGAGWNFFQLCGLLRIAVNYIPASAKRLEIDFNGKKVCGDFSIASPVVPGSSSIESVADDANDVIKITKDGTDVVLGETSLMLNIPLPAGEYADVTITAYDALVDGNAILSITRLFDRTSTIQRAFKRTATFPSSKTAFRGYEVSSGILQRNVVGTDAAYSLTAGEMEMTYDPTTGKEVYALPAGCNPFEPAIYYGNKANLNKYFHKWLTLRTELGANGNNINTTSDNLPDHWRFPSGGGTQYSTGTDWGNILFATPKSTIMVNGTAVANNAYAMVNITLAAGNIYGVAAKTYNGMLLLRDGTTIPSGYLNKVGLSSTYSDNSLTEAQFNYLVQLGCLFVPATGYFDDTFNVRGSNPWRDLNSYYQEGYYWTSTYWSENSFVFFTYDGSGSVSTSSHSNSSYKRYHIVKLVKPVLN